MTVIAWSCEALALVGLGVMTKKAYIWQPAVLLYGCALGLLAVNPNAFHYQSVGGPAPSSMSAASHSWHWPHRWD